MIVDSSAVVAILLNESDAQFCADVIQNAHTRRISAASYLESAIVVDSGNDPVSRRRFDELLAEAAFVVEPVTAEQAIIAREAYREFGKGRGHPAQLNFGDCFAYALARTTKEPLLCLGDDFVHTDISTIQP